MPGLKTNHLSIKKKKAACPAPDQLFGKHWTPIVAPRPHLRTFVSKKKVSFPPTPFLPLWLSITLSNWTLSAWRGSCSHCKCTAAKSSAAFSSIWRQMVPFVCSLLKHLSSAAFASQDLHSNTFNLETFFSHAADSLLLHTFNWLIILGLALSRLHYTFVFVFAAVARLDCRWAIRRCRSGSMI